MAKESMKAREVKRAKLVEKYAAKRAKLKEEGDYIGLSLLPKNSSRRSFAQQMQIDGKTERVHETIWYKQNSIPRNGICRTYTWS